MSDVHLSEKSLTTKDWEVDIDNGKQIQASNTRKTNANTLNATSKNQIPTTSSGNLVSGVMVSPNVVTPVAVSPVVLQTLGIQNAINKLNNSNELISNCPPSKRSKLDADHLSTTNNNNRLRIPIDSRRSRRGRPRKHPHPNLLVNESITAPVTTNVNVATVSVPQITSLASISAQPMANQPQNPSAASDNLYLIVIKKDEYQKSILPRIQPKPRLAEIKPNNVNSVTSTDSDKYKENHKIEINSNNKNNNITETIKYVDEEQEATSKIAARISSFIKKEKSIMKIESQTKFDSQKKGVIIPTELATNSKSVCDLNKLSSLDKCSPLRSDVALISSVQSKPSILDVGPIISNIKSVNPPTLPSTYKPTIISTPLTVNTEKSNPRVPVKVRPISNNNLNYLTIINLNPVNVKPAAPPHPLTVPEILKTKFCKIAKKGGSPDEQSPIDDPDDLMSDIQKFVVKSTNNSLSSDSSPIKSGGSIGNIKFDESDIDPSNVNKLSRQLNTLKSLMYSKEREIENLRSDLLTVKRYNNELFQRVKRFTNADGSGGLRLKAQQPKVLYSNINILVNHNRNVLSKEPINDGFRLFCNICRENGKVDGIKNKYSLATGLEYQGRSAMEMDSGIGQQWYNLKRTLVLHMEAHKSDDDNISATKHIITMALTAVKLKLSTRHFTGLLSTTKIFGADIGNRCHSQKQLPKIVKELRSYALLKLRNQLTTVSNRTSITPQFTIVLDKIVLNGQMYQIVMLLFRIDGIPMAIPVDCSLVFGRNGKIPQDLNKLDEGKLNELVDFIVRTLTEHIQLSTEDFNSISAVYFNSDYGDDFQKRLKTALAIPDDQYVFLIHCLDDWLDSSVKKLSHSLKFFELFLKRCQKFQSVFKVAKIKEECTVHNTNISLNDNNEANTSNEDISPFDNNNASSSGANNPRFSVNFLKDLKVFFHSYPMLFASFDHDEDFDKQDEVERYFLSGRDFLMDLCVMIDIFSPIVEIMLRVKSTKIPVWKVGTWFPRLFKVLREMGDDLRLCIDEDRRLPTNYLFPYLNPNWEGILDEKRAYDHWYEMERKKHSCDGVLLQIRSLESCIYDYVGICEVLRKCLADRYQMAMNDNLRVLRNCFDLEDMLEELVEINEYPDNQRIPLLNEYYDNHCRDFENFFSIISMKPKLSKFLHGSNSKEIYRNWRELFYNMIWKHSYSVISWFVNKKGEKVLFDYDIKTIKIGNEEGILNRYYNIHLIDGTVISDVKFVEDDFMQYITFDSEFLQTETISHELLLVLHYVHSLYSIDAPFDSVYYAMKSQEKEGGQSMESLIHRTIVDCLYPTAIQCPNTLHDIARYLYYVCNFNPVCNSRKRKKEDNKLYESRVFDRIIKEPPKFPFLLNDKDLKDSKHF